MGDELRLTQVLINLGGNAVKFTERGTIVMGLKVRGRTTTEVLLEFSVQDSGIGIPSDQLSRIFEGFSQAEASTTRRYGGTGLGLTISQRLVSLMGGNIEVDSEPGKGSTFRFALRMPLPDAAAPVDTPEPVLPSSVASSRPLAGLRVLVAEDNVNNQEVAQELLRLAGAEVELAEDGEQAVAAVFGATSAFDVVLMDVHMPRLSGYDATIRIRMRPEFKSLPIIAMTANAMASDREKCLACGMTDHIAKPIDLQLLIHAILRHVRNPMESEPAMMDLSKAARDLVPEKSTHGAFAPDAVTAAQRYGIDLQASVARLGAGPAFYQRMARNCISDIPQIVNDMEQALLQGDRERLLDEAHKLKGPCGILGAQVLVSLAVAIEAAPNLPGDLLAATMHVNQLRSLTDGLSADATLILGSLAP